MVAAGFVKTIPIDRGKTSTPAPVVAPGLPVPNVTRPKATRQRRGCRKALEPMASLSALLKGANRWGTIARNEVVVVITKHGFA